MRTKTVARGIHKPTKQLASIGRNNGAACFASCWPCIADHWAQAMASEMGTTSFKFVCEVIEPKGLEPLNLSTASAGRAAQAAFIYSRNTFKS